LLADARTIAMSAQKHTFDIDVRFIAILL